MLNKQQLQMNENLESIKLGNLWIDARDEEQARLVLARAVGQPEPVLYEDESPYLSNQVDEDMLAQVIELQDRMNTGLKIIKERDELLTPYVQEYISAKEAFEKAKAYLTKYNVENDGTSGFPYWKRFNHLKAMRKQAYDLMANERVRLNLQGCWNLYWLLREECELLTEDNKALWAVLLSMEDKEQWQQAYLSGDRLPSDSREDFKKSDPMVDNRMLTTDEAFYQGHQEAQQELFAYNK